MLTECGGKAGCGERRCAGVWRPGGWAPRGASVAVGMGGGGGAGRWWVWCGKLGATAQRASPGPEFPFAPTRRTALAPEENRQQICRGGERVTRLIPPPGG